MKILIAEDDETSRSVLTRALAKWEYEAVITDNGEEAWQKIQTADDPVLAILDWMMPVMDGIEVCRKVREAFPRRPIYIILLTAKERTEDVVAGLQAGADDYVTKPFDLSELKARIQVGERMVKLQSELAARVNELEEALSHVKQLQGLLPICCYCKKVRDDKDYWQDVETYFSERSDLLFSHGYCPACFETKVKPKLEEWQRRKREELQQE